MVTQPDETWKVTRKAFNPGFSSSYLASLVPAFTEETQSFVHLLSGHVKSGEPIKFLDEVIFLTLDIICRVVCSCLSSFLRFVSFYFCAYGDDLGFQGFGMDNVQSRLQKNVLVNNFLQLIEAVIPIMME
jgi:hypothetical protein